MKLSKKILELTNKYSFEVYYLLDNHKMSTRTFYEILKTNDKEKLLKKITKIKKINISQIESKYSKNKYFYEILSDTNKYHHLNDIKEIVRLDKVINTVISDNIYNQKLHLFYTDLIIDKIVLDFYDYDDIKLLSNWKFNLISKDNELIEKIMKNIDHFYIKRITI